VKVLQLPHTQLVGQAPRLQGWVLLVDPKHNVPPPDAGTATVLTLVWVPGPQVAEQEDQFPQAVHVQFIAQVHVVVEVSVPLHPSILLPGLIGTKILVCICVPVVQLQALSADQGPHLQVGGQGGLLLHACVCRLDPVQSFPPKAACTAGVLVLV